MDFWRTTSGAGAREHHADRATGVRRWCRWSNRPCCPATSTVGTSSSSCPRQARAGKRSAHRGARSKQPISQETVSRDSPLPRHFQPVAFFFLGAILRIRNHHRRAENAACQAWFRRCASLGAILGTKSAIHFEFLHRPWRRDAKPVARRPRPLSEWQKDVPLAGSLGRTEG